MRAPSDTGAGHSFQLALLGPFQSICALDPLDLRLGSQGAGIASSGNVRETGIVVVFYARILSLD